MKYTASEMSGRAKPVKLNSRTLKHLRDAGWRAEVVEHKIPKSFITRDLFGFIDVLAMRPKSKLGGILGVQVTVRAKVNDRIAKAIDNGLAGWLAAGGRFEVHGWSKKGARGARKVWTLFILECILIRGKIVTREI